MSSSKAKKERQLAKEQGGMNKRAAEAMEKQKAKKKTRKLVIIVVAIIAVLLAITLVLNSKFIRRDFTALTVGDMEFTVAEYEFFYYNCYYDYYAYVYSDQSLSTYASMLLPQAGIPHGSQMYSDTETWKDFFDEYTLNAISRYVGVYNEAQSVGFTLSDEQIETFESDVSDLNSTAELYGYTDVDDYLVDFYGSSATVEIVTECLRFIYYCDSYEEYYTESLVYTDEEIDAKYESEKDMYDLFEYRYFLVSSEEVDETLYETEEELEAAEAEALQASFDKAEGYLARVDSEEDFIAVAKEYDSETYEEEDSTLRRYNGELLGSTYGDWLRDSSRKYGDTTVVEFTTGTYVLFYIGRSDNHYDTVNANMLVVPVDAVDAEDYEDEEDDTAYNEAVEAAKEDARIEAEDILQQWKDGGATAELFEEYMDDYYTNYGYGGGFTENIYQDQFSEEINDWLYDPSRTEGDTTVIYSENAASYYIIYYCGIGAVYAEDMAEDDLREADTYEWDQQLTEGIEATKTWLFALDKSGAQISQF